MALEMPCGPRQSSAGEVGHALHPTFSCLVPKTNVTQRMYGADVRLHEWAHECIRSGVWKGSSSQGDGWNGEAALRYPFLHPAPKPGRLGIPLTACLTANTRPCRYLVSSHFDSEMMGEALLHTQGCLDICRAFANLVRCCTLQGTPEARADSMPEVFLEVELQQALLHLYPPLKTYFTGGEAVVSRT